ncbi:MAG: restriction endonuclease subunit S [Pirellulaceae bacterium]|nr:restriction endonuclease subunit S [Pirellulaceae bacterium]
MSWETIQLGEFLTLKRGYDLSSVHRADGEVPIVSSSGITGYHNVAKVAGPGVVTGRYGTLGEVFFVKDDFWPLNTALYVQDFKGNDPRFTAYFLKCVLRGTSSDKAAVPGVNRNDLHARRVRVTRNKSRQIAIASILSPYDDLIENNRRRIQLLEAAARLLYQEWFVHLRFPGHEHVPITDGVPEGWERKPFADLAIFMNGFPFAPDDLGETGLPVVKIPELRDGPTTKTPRNTGEQIPEKYVIRDGDILFSWSGTLLVNIWNHGIGLLNQHLFKVTPISASLRGIVYLGLRQALVEFHNQTTGATMRHIRKGALETVRTLVPHAPLREEFESSVSPMLEQIGILQRQVAEATKARDVLLPRLMNGEVSV